MEQENEIARDDSPRSANELMQEYAVLVTAEAIENREKCKIVPYVAMLHELKQRAEQDFMEAMRQLCRQKVLEAHLNLNQQVMFEFAKPK